MTETTQQRDGLKWLNDMGVAEVHYFHCGGRYAGKPIDGLKYKICDEIKLNKHPGTWKIFMIFTNKNNKEHEGRYMATRINGHGDVGDIIKLNDEEVKTIRGWK